MDEKDYAKQEKQYAKRLRPILLFFVGLSLIAIVVVLFYGIETKSLANCIIWAMACLISGAAIGFLFGIPKILQGSKTAASEKQQQDYQLHVNTNLTEISDWLTKIIVGLGLVKLTKLPPYITSLAVALADGIRDKDRGVAMAFAYGTISCFTISGFLFGYLFTRLYLSKALSIADQESQESLQQLKGELEIQIANIESKQGLFTHSLSQDVRGHDLVDHREVPEMNTDQQMAILTDMANVYLNISIADRAERTRVKDVKANEMGIYALTHDIPAETIFNYIKANPPTNEGLVLALATLINTNPFREHLPILLQAGQNLTRLHVRYRVLLAIVTLQKKGFIAEKDKQQVLDLVNSYRLKADDSLLQQIEATLSFLNS